MAAVACLVTMMVAMAEAAMEVVVLMGFVQSLDVRRSGPQKVSEEERPLHGQCCLQRLLPLIIHNYQDDNECVLHLSHAAVL